MKTETCQSDKDLTVRGQVAAFGSGKVNNKIWGVDDATEYT
jgi:hypothetical protein